MTTIPTVSTLNFAQAVLQEVHGRILEDVSQMPSLHACASQVLADWATKRSMSAEEQTALKDSFFTRIWKERDILLDVQYHTDAKAQSRSWFHNHTVKMQALYKVIDDVREEAHSEVKAVTRRILNELRTSVATK